MSAVAQRRAPGRNVIGTELVECGLDIGGSGIDSGFYRDGHCDTGPEDRGQHHVCVETTDSFLSFSAAVGNPLHVPVMRDHFPGLKAGDRWCLCAERWVQAQSAGFAPKLVLKASHEKMLDFAPLETLREFGCETVA